jgi:drug/metabolite transporter (DMT)-like permease
VWIAITLAAATFQILRTSRQHELREHLSTAAAGFVRYAYGAPLAVVAWVVMFWLAGRAVPGIPDRFWPMIVGAGAAQILGTLALLAAFKTRDFAIGTVCSKAEVLIVAGLGLVGVGTGLRPAGWIGAAVLTAGVVWLAAGGSVTSLARSAGDRAAWLGLAAGAGFGLAAIGIRGASRSLTDAPSFDRALFTLTVLLILQAVANATWFALTDRAELAATARAWRPAMWVGLLSLLGSIGWAWAFTLESAAKVRTLGQIELLIAFAVARFTMGERHGPADLAASAMVLAGVVTVTLAG